MSLVVYHIMYISDINECEGPSPCDENAQCANTIGSFTCACNEGYSGDGMTCTGQNFPAKDANLCLCVNFILPVHPYYDLACLLDFGILTNAPLS